MLEHSRNFLKSLGFACSGFKQALQYEFNLRIHTILAVLSCVLGLMLGLSRIEWLVLILTISIVLFAELFNTAIEAYVDLAVEEQHPDAKLAKDVAAAAVLLVSIAALIIGILLFGEKLLELF